MFSLKRGLSGLKVTFNAFNRLNLRQPYGTHSIGSVSLFYEKQGEGRHPVLLLPGALGSTRTDFAPQLDNINKQIFTLIAMDPRGYGKSRPPDRSFPLVFFDIDAKDAYDMMTGLGYKKFSVLGWSDGGITAMVLAAKYPDAVHKMVIWGSNAYVNKQDLEAYEKIRDIDKWSAKMRQPFEALYGKEYFKATWNAWIDCFQKFYDTRSGNICLDELTKISCPTLIIHGLQDPIVGKNHPDYLKMNIRHSKLVYFPEGKHNLHLRYYKEFNKIAEDFLLIDS